MQVDGDVEVRGRALARNHTAPTRDSWSMILEEFAHLREPRRTHITLIDDPDQPVRLHVMLIPTFGDVTELDWVAGCRFHQAALADLAVRRPRGDFPCVLIREPTNPYDERAIAVWTRTGRCGYIARAKNAELLPRLIALEEEYGLPIAVRGDLTAMPFGLGLVIEVPEPLRR